MQDWAEILKTLAISGFGTILGFVLGLLAEPLKTRVQDRIARRRIENILTDEINSLALEMHMYLGVRKNSEPASVFPAKPNFGSERYDFVYRNDRRHFYAIPACDSITRFYDAVKKVEAKTEPLSNRETQDVLVEFELLEDRIRDGLFGKHFRRRLINDKLSFLTKLVTEYSWKQFAGA